MRKLTDEIIKGIEKQPFYNVENFLRDVKDWTRAIKSGAMLCIIHNVSSSGMTRKMEFTSFQRNKTRGYFRQYISMLTALGYSFDNNQHVIIRGCGMDMVFNTNYNVIHDFYRLGLISKKACSELSQMTPACR